METKAAAIAPASDPVPVKASVKPAKAAPPQPDADDKIGGLILEVKGDFCGQVREILKRHGREDDYIELGRRAGFVMTQRRGIFPTVPVVTRLIRKHPRALMPLHRALTRLLPVPGWCFLNLLTFRKP